MDLHHGAVLEVPPSMATEPGKPGSNTNVAANQLRDLGVKWLHLSLSSISSLAERGSS